MRYTPGYCEENIWHLCADPGIEGTNKQVLWISSLERICPIWGQRLAANPDEPVWWDYHVILLSDSQSDQWTVWDLDTTLGLGVKSGDYFTQSFRQPMPVSPVYRLMDADYYRARFCSDRSHMRSANGTWLATPPAWPMIGQGESTFTDMLDMESQGHGQLLSLQQLTDRFT